MRFFATNRIKLHKAVFVLAALVFLGVMERTASADPLVFSNVTAFQNNDMTQVDLFSNPGTTLFGPNLTFSVDIAGALGPGAVDTLMITYNELGSAPIILNFQIPLFGTLQPPFTLLFPIVSPGATTLGVPATLTVDLLNSNPDFVIPGGPNQGASVNTFTYSFNVAEPVPEPATLLALAGGLAALGLKVRRRE